MRLYIFLLQLSREIINQKLPLLQETTKYGSGFWFEKERHFQKLILIAVHSLNVLP